MIDQARLRELQPMKKEQHTNTRVNSHLNPTQKVTSAQAYVERGPILITSDFQLNNSGFTGNGTIDDPIRIENFNITDPSDTLVGLIDIRSTTYYFSIVNCLINGLGTIGNGIYFDDVIHGTVVNNTIYNNGWSGVNIARRSDFNIVVNNTIFDNSEDGIRLGEGTASYNNTVHNNTIYNNGWSGIKVDASENNTIEYNTIYNSGGVGIDFSGSDNCSIIENHVYSNKGSGIYSDNSDNNEICNNSIHENVWNGMHLEQSYNNIIFNNSIHDHDYNGILLISASNNIVTDNYVHEHELEGISLGDSVNNTLKNNIVDNNRYGIGLSFSKNNSIEDNSLTNNGIFIGGRSSFESYIQKSVLNNSVNGKPFVYWEDKNGGTVPKGAGQIFLFNCTNVTIADQTLSNTSVGILTVYSSNLAIHNNILFNSRWAIFVDQYTNESVITNNTGYNNHGDIQLWSADSNIVSNNTLGKNSNYGIYLDSAENNTFSNNTIFKTNLSGILVWGSNNNNFSHNIIYDNEIYGITIDDTSSDTIVKSNDFLGNNIGGSQAADDGSNNVFECNYWSDWTGTGTYSIDGTTENQDPSPLTNPFHISIPSITAPSTGSTLEGDVVIQWSASRDSFGHSLTYSVLYSANDGESWITLATNLTTATYTLDTTTIADGTIFLKIQAVDTIGFISQTVSAVLFLIDNDQLTVPTILFPNGGETLSGSVTLTWSTAYDSAGHTVTYTVYYSADEGAIWIEIASGLTTTSSSWDTTKVPNGFSYLIKVVAICSEGASAEDVSDDTFIILNEIGTSTTMTTTTTSSSQITPGMTGFILVWVLGILVAIRKRRER